MRFLIVALLCALSYAQTEISCTDIADSNSIVIDVRTESEWDAGHLACAHLVTLNTYFTEENLETLTSGNKDTKIILYCRSGGRAGSAQSMAIGWGYTDVTNALGYDDIIAAGCSCEDFTCTNEHSASWADYRTVYVHESTIVPPTVENHFCECLSTKIISENDNMLYTLVSLDGSQFSLGASTALEDAYNEICSMSMGSSECSSCQLENPFSSSGKRPETSAAF